VFRLLFFLPLACWVPAARSSRHRIRTVLVLAVIAGAELVVSFEAWPLRHCRDSVEVLLTLAGIVVLTVGLIIDRRASSTPTIRTRAGAVLSALYCIVAGLGVLFVMAADSGTLDGPGGNGGKHVPVPSTELLLPLPTGLVVRNDSARCSGTNWGPYCTRTFTIGSTGGTPDSEVADHIRQHLQNTLGAAFTLTASGPDGMEWESCRTAGWWLDRENEHIWVYSSAPGAPPVDPPNGWSHISLHAGRGDDAPPDAATTVEFGLDHQGC
jgi:hypothetical protein